MSDGDDGHGAVRVIARNHDLRAEAESVLPLLADRCRKAAPEEIMRVLITNAPALGIPDRSPDEWGALFGVYLEALGELPVEAIEEAFRRWHHCELYPKDPGRHAFFPRPAEVFKLAQPRREALLKAAFRAKEALRYQAPASRKEPTPEERAEVQRMAEEACNALGARTSELQRDGPPKLAATPNEAAKALRAQAEDWPEEAI